ncbi:hypothetical protein A2U01_0032956 [Trifolium medium]|uniref:Uncharacterized protein n=1 Tax=Trifolium medium TaxID=97028 RepID=A0A392PJ68_9FABA|nr:hypothetical protein [Trifolium medium]
MAVDQARAGDGSGDGNDDSGCRIYGGDNNLFFPLL